jgi:hypothetical protein
MLPDAQQAAVAQELAGEIVRIVDALVGGQVGRHRRIRASAVDAWVASPKEAKPRPVSPARSRTGSMTSRGPPTSFVARVHRGVDS